MDVLNISRRCNSNRENELFHNPAILIETGDYKPSEFKGKTLQSE